MARSLITSKARFVQIGFNVVDAPETPLVKES